MRAFNELVEWPGSIDLGGLMSPSSLLKTCTRTVWGPQRGQQLSSRSRSLSVSSKLLEGWELAHHGSLKVSF
jgi:predicted ATPase